MDNIILSSTLVKAFLHNGTEREEFCPKKIKEMVIEGDYDLSSEAIQRGNFFETQCIGSSRDGQRTDFLPLKKNGGKTVVQERLERQVKNFYELCKKYGIILTNDNTQIKIAKKLSDGVYLQGHPDICPVVVTDPRHGKTLAEIDLKLAKNLRTTWGEYCWGEYHRYDDIQAQIYLELARDLDLELNDHLNPDVFGIVKKRGEDMQFYYWVFSYHEGMYQGEYVPLESMVIRAEKSPLKRSEMMESLRKTYKLIKYYEGRWDPVPGNSCAGCPVDCPVKLTKGDLQKLKEERKKKYEDF